MIASSIGGYGGISPGLWPSSGPAKTTCADIYGPNSPNCGGTPAQAARDAAAKAPAPVAAAQTIAQGIGGMGGAGVPSGAPTTGPQVGADPAISMQGLNAAVGGGSGEQATPSVINAPGGLRQSIGARIYPEGSKKLRTGMY